MARSLSSSQSSSRGPNRNSTISSNTKPTTNTTTTRNARPYDRDFQRNLIDGGVYPHRYEYPDGRIPAKPNNWEEVNQGLAQPRPSRSPSKFSEEAHEQFVRADAHAFKEDQEKSRLQTSIISQVARSFLATQTSTTVPAPEQLNRQVRDELSDQIIPSTQHDLPIVPNFLLEAKGPGGSIAVAGRQASYDGVLGARGIQSLQSYRQEEPAYNNNAYTITSIYHGGTLKMYTTHPTQAEDGSTEYHMTQINTWGMTGNTETFRQGATMFRNARDWTKEQRDESIRYANDRANDIPNTTPASSALASSFTTEVSTLVATTSQQASLKAKSLLPRIRSRRHPRISLRWISIHRPSALQGRNSLTAENVTNVHPALGKAVQLREPSKSNISHGLMANSAASEGRRRSDCGANVQPMCGYISKKVGQVKEERNRGAA